VDESSPAIDGMDYWRLCDDLSVVQAALLIVGRDPGTIDSRVESLPVHERPIGYQAVRTALCKDILEGRLGAKLRDSELEGDPLGEWTVFEGIVIDELPLAIHRSGAGESAHRRGDGDQEEPDWSRTTVSVVDLRAWLNVRGFKSGFFFSGSVGTPGYLDPKNERYAPKLAAAVHAWLALDDPKKLGGRSPKAALRMWLNEHAAELSLTKKDGSRNKEGIEDVATIANWKPEGGSPTTPGKS